MMEQDALYKELDQICDAYKLDVRQFIEFMKSRRLELVKALKEYAAWLDEEHEGKRYSPATINRKIAAAKSRVRYAFRHSSSGESLRAKYQLHEVLQDVKLKKIDTVAVSAERAPSIDEINKLFRETKDGTIKLMVAFLVGTGVRVSEMLAIKLSDLIPAEGDFVSIRIVGKGGKGRVVYIKVKLVDRIRKHFQGELYLFEHHGRPFNRISVTNRIKYESLRTIHREVTAGQLRHAWAVIQIRRGKDVKTVAAALGHSALKSTVGVGADEALAPHEAFLDILETEKSGNADAEGRDEEVEVPDPCGRG